MKKITLIIKIFIFLFFTCIIVNMSFYAYAFITPKFQINTSKNITFYDKDNNDILKDNIENDSYELEKFKYPIFNNCLPHIDKFLENGYTKEEEKMINETRKILGKPDLPITATAVRVPVFNSHCETINIEFELDFDIDEIVKILKNSPGIIVKDEPDSEIYAIPENVTGHNEIFVSRIRRDYSVKSGLNLWVVGDNIRKGAASNAVQILKMLI